MNQFNNALTIINFKKSGVLEQAIDTFLKQSIIASVKKSITGILSEVVSAAGILTGNQTIGFFSRVSQQILNAEGIGEDTVDFYQFKINPQNFSFPRQKIMSNILTGGGWDSDTRGEQLVTVRYSATTGSLVPNNTYNNILMELARDLLSRTSPLVQFAATTGLSLATNDLYYQMANNPKLSSRYIKFLLFDAFWRANDDDLLIIWEDNAYIGKFVNFSYRPDATRPWEIQYEFTISVYPNFTYNIYTGSITKDISRIKRRFNLNKKIEKARGTVTTVDTKSQPDTTDLQAKSLDEENFYKERGTLLYNKAQSDYLSNTPPNLKTDFSSLSPEEIAKAYRLSGGDFIDIFEEYYDLELRTQMSIQTSGISTQQVSGQSTNLGLEPINNEKQIALNSLTNEVLQG